MQGAHALLGTPMWVVESPLNIMKRTQGVMAQFQSYPIFCTSPFFGESLSAMLALSRSPLGVPEWPSWSLKEAGLGERI